MQQAWGGALVPWHGAEAVAVSCSKDRLNRGGTRGHAAHARLPPGRGGGVGGGTPMCQVKRVTFPTVWLIDYIYVVLLVYTYLLLI